MERLEQEQRPQGRRQSRLVAWALLLAVSLVAGYLFISSSYFALGRVVVEGTKYISEEDVFQAANIPAKVNIFRLSTTDIQRRLSHDLRVATVEVIRQYPATIVIRITERMPVAYVACTYGFLQLDNQGMVMAALKNIKEFNLPIITGVRLGNIYVGDKADVQQVLPALEYLSGLDEATLNQLSEVNIKPTGEMMAYTLQRIVLRLGTGERMKDKAKLTNEIFRDIGGKSATIEYIDLNYASPYIKFRR